MFCDTHKAIYTNLTQLKLSLQNRGIIIPSSLQMMFEIVLYLHLNIS